MDFLGGMGPRKLTERHSGSVPHRHLGPSPQEPSQVDFLGGMGPLQLTERHSGSVPHRHLGPRSRLRWIFLGAWVPAN